MINRLFSLQKGRFREIPGRFQGDLIPTASSTREIREIFLNKTHTHARRNNHNFIYYIFYKNLPNLPNLPNATISTFYSREIIKKTSLNLPKRQTSTLSAPFLGVKN